MSDSTLDIGLAAEVLERLGREMCDLLHEKRQGKHDGTFAHCPTPRCLEATRLIASLKPWEPCPGEHRAVKGGGWEKKR